MASKMSVIDWIAYVLLVVGGVNWLLYGISPGLDLVALVGGGYTVLARVIYILVGIASVYGLVTGVKLFLMQYKMWR